MSVMFVLMVIIAGMAVALAVYFLVSGIFAYEPQMGADTVNDLGILPAVLVFALCGPVLVLKLFFSDKGDADDVGGIGAFFVTGAVSLFWSGMIGVVATQSVYMAIAPMAAGL